MTQGELIERFLQLYPEEGFDSIYWKLFQVFYKQGFLDATELMPNPITLLKKIEHLI
jgi:hypothetical protein